MTLEEYSRRILAPWRLEMERLTKEEKKQREKDLRQARHYAYKAAQKEELRKFMGWPTEQQAQTVRLVTREAVRLRKNSADTVKADKEGEPRCPKPINSPTPKP